VEVLEHFALPCSLCAPKRTRAANDPPLDLVEQQHEHEGQRKGESDQERAYGRHQDAQCRQPRDDEQIAQGGDEQRPAGKRRPETAPLAHDIYRRLTGEDQHEKHERLRLGKRLVEHAQHEPQDKKRLDQQNGGQREG